MSNLLIDPGLHADVSMIDYLRLPYASSHRLRMLRDLSPAHVRWHIDNPGTDATDATTLGTAVHVAVLEPELFPASYVRGVEGDGRTKAVKEAREALAAENPGKIVLPPADFDLCSTFRDRIAAHPKARKLLQGRPEHTAVWDDPETGVRCRGRFDLLSDVSPVIVDLKTTRDASPSGFARAVYQYGYYLQGAMYLQGAQEVGFEARHFVIVALEKEPPYDVAIYDLDGESLSYGAEEVRSLLMLWKRCEESGEWPGYPRRVQSLGLPEYAVRRVQERIEA